MNEYNFSLDETLVWLAMRHKECAHRALATWREALALSFSPEIDKDLAFYIDYLINWPRGNVCWSFEGGRYFGSNGLRIQEERVVELSPRKRP